MSNITAPHPINRYGLEEDTAKLGGVYKFRDYDLSGVGDADKPLLSAMEIEAVLVVNNTGDVLTSGTAVKWDTGSTYGPRKAVSAKSGDGDIVNGIVPPYLPSGGIPDGDFFFLITKGPCLVQYDGSANIAISDKLSSAATGYLREFVPGTDEDTELAGVALAAKSSGSAGDTFRAFVNCQI